MESRGRSYRAPAASGDLAAVERHLGRIRQALNHMRALLDGLLTTARVDHEPRTSQRVDLGELAREAVALVDNQVRERGIEVVVHPGLPWCSGTASACARCSPT